MNVPMFVQGVVIALIVGWSALSAARRLMPVTSRRAQARIVGALDRPSVPSWLRSLAHRLQPLSTSGGSCADGCSSCGGCASAAATPLADAQPLAFRPRQKI